MNSSETLLKNNESRIFDEHSTGNTSIPILMCDKVISDKEHWYMLRLTPMDKYDIHCVTAMLIDVQYANHWLISTETSAKGKLHFHCLFTCEFDPRGNIKNWLSELFPGPWKKEDGNKRYNLELVTDLRKCMTYIVKDGSYINSTTINPDYIADCVKKSFKKYSKEEFTLRFEKLKADYKEDIITNKELRAAIIRLKGEYRQPINLTRISEIVLSCMVNKDPSLADDL